ncbi:MAG: adenylate kinase [Acidobacteria bacterium]|nr:MAG: adenylate kinase [Acidobacteriota bacterium]
MRIVFLGPPNSGKGTQAALLAEALGVPAISTGEMLRAAVAAGSALGARVKDVMARGELVSDELMAEVVRQRLSQDDVAGGCILDGYPRTVAQARTLEEILGPRGIDHVILVEAPEEVLIARALGRGREDDREEVVRERLRVYRDKTAPLEAYYEDRGLLRRIDGARSIDEVQAAIESVLGVRRVG